MGGIVISLTPKFVHFFCPRVLLCDWILNIVPWFSLTICTQAMCDLYHHVLMLMSKHRILGMNTKGNGREAHVLVAYGIIF